MTITSHTPKPSSWPDTTDTAKHHMTIIITSPAPVVITKLDGTARGGVALAVSSEAHLPIRFIGAGEGIRDLRPFNSFEFVEALLASR